MDPPVNSDFLTIKCRVNWPRQLPFHVIWMCQVRISAGIPTNPVVRAFFSIPSQIPGKYCFLPHSFQFITHRCLVIRRFVGVAKLLNFGDFYDNFQHFWCPKRTFTNALYVQGFLFTNLFLRKGLILTVLFTR